LDLA
ncbi:cytochrome c554 and c-prime family protein, partial [Vibrio parahaemolyticus VP2007-007]|jgi:hypothetical protein